MKPRGLLGRISLMGLSTFVALTVVAIGGELAARQRERHRDSVPGTMPMLFYRHGRLRHALVRDFDYYGWLRVNRSGFRGKEIALDPDSGVIRVMAVGGSTTMDGAVSPDDRAWPARLEYWLIHLDSARRYEVINAGVSGYRVLDHLIRLQTELYRYRPQVIVLYVAHNDLFSALGGATRAARGGESAFDHRPGEAVAVAPWIRWLERHSLLYAKLAGRWQAIRFQVRGGQARSRAVPGSYDLALEQGIEQFERDLTGFLALARNLKIPVVLPQVVSAGGPGMDTAAANADSTLRTLWRIAIPFAPPEMVRRGYVRYDSVIQAAVARFGATYIPTGSFGLADPAFYADGDAVHFNVRGAEIMAEHLARALLRVPGWPGASQATP